MFLQESHWEQNEIVEVERLLLFQCRFVLAPHFARDAIAKLVRPCFSLNCPAVIPLPLALEMRESTARGDIP